MVRRASSESSNEQESTPKYTRSIYSNIQSPDSPKPGVSEDRNIPVLTECEKRELVSLVKDKNMSMDFILEMKEAFLLFDKVLCNQCMLGGALI